VRGTGLRGEMTISQGFLDELKARVGLVDLVARRVKLVRRGREHTGLCPFHNEKSPSFTVNEDKGFYHCFGCGAHGNAIDFVINTEGLSFPEAVEKLASEAGLQVPRSQPVDREREQKRRSLYDVMEAAAGWFESQLASQSGTMAREYLQGRGLTRAIADRFRLGYGPDRRDAMKAALLAREFKEAQLVEAGLLITPEDGGTSYDRFRNRLMFPITDRRGRVVAFGGRALGEQRAKYLNSPETPLFHKGRLLYNLAQAREAAHAAGTVIVAEGYMDVIALDQAGFHHAVAPLGTALTEEQIVELWRLTAEPILCFDGDAAGQRAAFRAAERALPLLKPGHSMRFMELPAGEDPDSLLRNEGAGKLRQLVEGASPLWDVLWRMETAGRQFDTPERRAGLRQSLRDLVARISDNTVREYYGQQFNEMLSSAFAPRRAARQVRPGGFRNSPRDRGGRFANGSFQADRLKPAQGFGAGVEGLTIRRERLLVAGLLNHPELVHEVFEDIADLSLNSQDLDNVLKAILKQATSGAPLDLDALKTNFFGTATGRLIEELTGPGTAKLDPFARPDTPLVQAKKDWTSVFRLHRLNDLRRDLRAAERALADDMTEENLARFTALRQAVEHAEVEATSAGGQLS
jgi:DNA primase